MKLVFWNIPEKGTGTRAFIYICLTPEAAESGSGLDVAVNYGGLCSRKTGNGCSDNLKSIRRLLLCRLYHAGKRLSSLRAGRREVHPAVTVLDFLGGEELLFPAQAQEEAAGLAARPAEGPEGGDFFEKS